MGSDLNGGGHGKEDSDENIIRMPTLAERDRMRREHEKAEKKLAKADYGPLINMPPVTLFLIVVILGIHILLTQILPIDQREWTIENFGFIPERFSSGDLSGFSLFTPLTHMALHGGWMHVAMNTLMLAAFGSGIERWLGSSRMLILFFASGLIGAATHYALNADSVYPMIGASGGLSGLFAAAIVMLNRGQREMGGRIGILPFAILWIGLSVAFGMLGGPDGSIIAWAAHVGGFLGGFAVLKLMRV
jgi:membrane associated rhomboid family serine protease